MTFILNMRGKIHTNVNIMWKLFKGLNPVRFLTFYMCLFYNFLILIIHFTFLILTWDTEVIKTQSLYFIQPNREQKFRHAKVLLWLFHYIYFLQQSVPSGICRLLRIVLWKCCLGHQKHVRPFYPWLCLARRLGKETFSEIGRERGRY